MAGQGSNAASGLEDSDQVGGYALWLAKGPMQLQAKKTLTRLCGYADCSDLNLRWSHMPTCTLSTSLTHCTLETPKWVLYWATKRSR